MKNHLLVVGVALVTFVVVFFVLDLMGGGDGGDVRVQQQGRAVDPLERMADAPRRARSGSPVAEQAAAQPVAIPGRETDELGEIHVVVKLPTGLVPAELEVGLRPDVGRFATTDDGWRTAVAPGSYTVVAAGGDLVPELRTVVVAAGKRTTVRMTVARGLRPRGRVLTVLERRPVAGADVVFGASVRVRTDDSGRFDAGRVLAQSELRLISIHHADYDDQAYRDFNITDPEDLTLYLGTGPGVMVGDVVNATSEPLPKRYVVRLSMAPLFQTRRELEVVDTTTFRFENLYEGTYRAELSFPGGEFPTQRQNVTMSTEEPQVTARFELIEGAVVRGVCLGPDEVLTGLTIELRNALNEVDASAVADEGNHYAMRNVAPGWYTPYVKTGGDGFYLPAIEITADAAGFEVVRNIDILRQSYID